MADRTAASHHRVNNSLPREGEEFFSFWGEDKLGDSCLSYYAYRKMVADKMVFVRFFEGGATLLRGYTCTCLNQQGTAWRLVRQTAGVSDISYSHSKNLFQSLKISLRCTKRDNPVISGRRNRFSTSAWLGRRGLAINRSRVRLPVVR